MSNATKPVASFREFWVKQGHDTPCEIMEHQPDSFYSVYNEHVHVIECGAVEDAYDRGILEGSRIGDACAAAARKERDQDMERLQGERVSIYKSNELLTQRNQELELALESFKTARIMADPSDIKEYIHNHEVAHKALPMNREK